MPHTSKKPENSSNKPKPLSYIELSRENVLHNVDAFRSYLAKDVQIAAVIKANAYGHGIPEMISILEDQVEYFQVDDLLELRTVRAHSQKPTLVLGYISSDALEEALTLNAEIAIYDTERLPSIAKIAEEKGLTPRLHLKIDSHMGRQGILVPDVAAFLEVLRDYPQLALAGVYSHFSNARDPYNLDHTNLQVKGFKEAVATVRAAGFKNFITHLSSTGGVLLYEKDTGHNPLVRIGGGMYGMYASKELAAEYSQLNLQPIVRWVSHVAQIKTVPANYPIGYSLTYRTEKEMKIAIIPQGYSDGYGRGLSNRGSVLIRGTYCKLLGRISMNMMTVDVSHIQDLKPEEEVVLLGAQGKEKISPEEQADLLDTINYEITTSLPHSLPRLIR
jgi:alanine racemase